MMKLKMKWLKHETGDVFVSCRDLINFFRYMKEHKNTITPRIIRQFEIINDKKNGVENEEKQP